jgi:hypothetical protein
MLNTNLINNAVLPALLPARDLMTVNKPLKGHLQQASKTALAASLAWAEWIEPVLKKKMFSDGGFTLTPSDARPVKSGISVCSDPAAILCLSSGNWDRARVLSWLAENKARLQQHDLNLGGWLDSEHGVMFLELVWVFPEHLKEACLLVASANGRRSVYNLGKKELIYLNDATGSNTAPHLNWNAINLEQHRREYFLEGCTLVRNLFAPELIAEWRTWSLANAKSAGVKLDACSDSTWVYQKPNERHAYTMVDGDALRRELPEMFEWYRALIPILSAITMQTVVPSPFKKSDINVLVYDNPGSAIGWHRDTNPITFLLYLSDNEEGGTECCLLKSRPDQQDSDRPRKIFKPQAGAVLLMQGRWVEHRSEPMSGKEVKAASPWNYYTDQDLWRPKQFDETIYGG